MVISELCGRDARGNVLDIDHQAYADPTVYQAELEKIFHSGWVLVGLEVEIPNPGDYTTTWVADIPVIVCRDEAGELRVLENVCAHRGATVIRGRGNRKVFTCIYHQWSYTLDGQLKALPMEEGYRPERFSKGDYRLRAFPRVESFCGLIFAASDPDVPSIKEYLGAAGGEVSEILKGGELELLGMQRYTVGANWKLFVENTIDTYHAPLLHRAIQTNRGGYNFVPGMGRSHKLGNGHNMLKWALTARAKEFEPQKDLPLTRCLSRTEGWNRSINLFPNVLVLNFEDVLSVRRLVPKGPDKVEMHAYVLAHKGEPEAVKANRAWVMASQLGIAGVASLDDKIAMELVQQGAAGRLKKTILLRGDIDSDVGDLTEEQTLRGFWEHWVGVMER